MSFKINQTVNTLDTVQYNYYETTFYKSQYQDTLENSGYIKIPYTSKPNEPNKKIEVLQALFPNEENKPAHA